jgi:ABC-type spermidine/putrescine transport system permease subunit I
VAEAAVTEPAGPGARPSQTVPPVPPQNRRRRRRAQQTVLQRSSLWPLLAIPGTVWLTLFFLAPMYVVLAIVFGRIDPVFRTPLPVWNPLQWNPAQFNYVFSHVVGAQGFFGPALLRTLLFVVVASLLCLLIAYPVAYFTARFAGKRKGIILTLLIAPFWISYMMRMLAWVNLLANDGIVNRIISLGGILPGDTEWLSGHGAVVVMGLVYGYVPYMIIPLYAGLDRLPNDLVEGARDLGASRSSAFRRVTWPMSRPVVIASVLLTCLPMLGDYYTNDLLSGSPETSMVGNLINNAVLAPGQTGQAGAFVLLVLLASLIPMLLYVRSTRDTEGVRS